MWACTQCADWLPRGRRWPPLGCSDAPPEAADSPPAPTAWRAVALVAAVAAAVHLAVAVRYGWHRDEFYYVICGRHPVWGLRRPAAADAAARAGRDGTAGLWPLRLLAIALQTGCIVLTARLAAELGGRRRAQVIAAAAVAACPIFVGASALYGTAGTDQFMWLATLVLIVRALRVERTSAWAFAGIAAGVGLQNKSTIAILLAGVLLGLFASRRDALRTIGPWLAGAIAVAFAIPNLVWDAGHGWPNLEMAKALSRAQGGTLGSLRSSCRSCSCFWPARCWRRSGSSASGGCCRRPVATIGGSR